MSERRRLAYALIEAGVTLGVLWLGDPARPPLAPLVWHLGTRTSRVLAAGTAHAARGFGRFAVACEVRYWAAVEQ